MKHGREAKLLFLGHPRDEAFLQEIARTFWPKTERIPNDAIDAWEYQDDVADHKDVRGSE